MIEKQDKNIATYIHLSALCQFIFPLGNLFAPLILWMVNKNKSEFIDAHGKQAVNFHLSIIIYTLILAIIMIPFIIYNVFHFVDFFQKFNTEQIKISFNDLTPVFYLLGFAILYGIAFIIEIVLIIIASISASNGNLYKYPFTINFIK